MSKTGQVTITLKAGEVICPTCGSEVVEFDTIDVEVDGTTVILFKSGECDHCGNHYQWHEEYALVGYRNLEQIHDESECEPDDLEQGFDPYEGCYTYDC